MQAGQPFLFGSNEAVLHGCFIGAVAAFNAVLDNLCRKFDHRVYVAIQTGHGRLRVDDAIADAVARAAAERTSQLQLHGVHDTINLVVFAIDNEDISPLDRTVEIGAVSDHNIGVVGEIDCAGLEPRHQGFSPVLIQEYLFVPPRCAQSVGSSLGLASFTA